MKTKIIAILIILILVLTGTLFYINKNEQSSVDSDYSYEITGVIGSKDTNNNYYSLTTVEKSWRNQLTDKTLVLQKYNHDELVQSKILLNDLENFAVELVINEMDELFIIINTENKTHSQHNSIPTSYLHLDQSDKDLYVIKMNRNLEYIWSRYIGGVGDDLLLSSSITPNNDILLAGSTNSIEFNTNKTDQNPDFNSFLLNLDASNGSIAWSTIFGGNGTDIISYMNLDAVGNIFLTGTTDSISILNSSIDDNHGTDIFVAAFSSNGVVNNSFIIGGTQLEYPKGLVVLDHIYLLGRTIAYNTNVTDVIYIGGKEITTNERGYFTILLDHNLDNVYTTANPLENRLDDIRRIMRYNMSIIAETVNEPELDHILHMYKPNSENIATNFSFERDTSVNRVREIHNDLVITGYSSSSELFGQQVYIPQELDQIGFTIYLDHTFEIKRVLIMNSI